ncbi:hypothetical protein C0V77_18065 [Emticicia sp. TH156]|nr:hypothetical protein C0V77_18065 [Emticicia sp. TH156]
MAGHTRQKKQIKAKEYVRKPTHTANVGKKPMQQECKKNIYFFLKKMAGKSIIFTNTQYLNKKNRRSCLRFYVCQN